MNIFKTVTLDNDRGSAIIAAVLMCLALSLAVFLAIDNTWNNNTMMQRSREYRDNLFKAETGLTVAVEEHRTTWLASASPLFQPSTNFGADPTQASFTRPNVTVQTKRDGTTMTVASYEAARIEGVGLPGSTSAEFEYKMDHIVPLSPGDASSVKNFEKRNYAIRSTAQPNNRLTVESGFSKQFNKPN